MSLAWPNTCDNFEAMKRFMLPVCLLVETRALLECTTPINRAPLIKTALPFNINTRRPTTVTTQLGTLTVPKIAVGTISWTKKSKSELKDVVQRCLASGLGLFDTAERYGASGAEVALGLGWGACETEVSVVSEWLHKRVTHLLHPSFLWLSQTCHPLPKDATL